jgi:hypothetical protein
MSRFRKSLVGWFVALMAFFVSANLAGLLRPMGLKPFRVTGFPLPIAAWGVGIEQFFDWSALAVNLGVAVVVSAGVAVVCAWARPGLLSRQEKTAI